MIEKPAWLQFEDWGGGRARLYGMPLTEHIGTHKVKLEVHDGGDDPTDSRTASQEFEIIVSSPESASIFDANNPDASDDQDVSASNSADPQSSTPITTTQTISDTDAGN